MAAICICLIQRRNHWEVGGSIPPYFNFQTKKGPIISVSNIRNISFYVCSEIMRIRNFTIFTVSALIFGQFTVVFSFSNYTGEIDHFTLDLLKKVRYLTLGLLKYFLLWTIRKNSTMNASLNVRL